MGSRGPVVRTTAAHKVDNGWEAVAMAASGVGQGSGKVLFHEVSSSLIGRLGCAA